MNPDTWELISWLEDAAKPHRIRQLPRIEKNPVPIHVQADLIAKAHAKRERRKLKRRLEAGHD